MIKYSLNLFLLGALAIAVTYFGLPMYKRYLFKKRMNAILKKIQIQVELYYKDDASPANK